MSGASRSSQWHSAPTRLRMPLMLKVAIFSVDAGMPDRDEGMQKKPAERSAGFWPYARQVLPVGLVALPPVVPAALPELAPLVALVALAVLLAPPDDSPGRSPSRRTRMSLLTSLTP
ncbi:hypothetical protein CT19431_MP80132 [Cupriavidus taiwanensis]|nr:hypothetical protein CT19431_MP80132 [Cupriavidus taiwanensis]